MGNNITNRQIMYSESEQLYLKSRALSYITTFKNLTERTTTKVKVTDRSDQ